MLFQMKIVKSTQSPCEDEKNAKFWLIFFNEKQVISLQIVHSDCYQNMFSQWNCFLWWWDRVAKSTVTSFMHTYISKLGSLKVLRVEDSTGLSLNVDWPLVSDFTAGTQLKYQLSL